MDKETKRLFIEEYETLCQKYGTYIFVDDGISYLKSIDIVDNFWFREQLQDLVDNDIDRDEQLNANIDKQIAGQDTSYIASCGFQPDIILFWGKTEIP